jgi:SAM-dependent methyltransferase
MRLRIACGKFLISIGNFIKSLAVVVMKPDDLVEYSRLTYSKPESISAFSEEEFLNPELSLYEEELLKKIPFNTGKLLVLEVGGGREAIPLAKMGFEVFGVDFIQEMTEQAKKNAARKGIDIEVKVQEISRLEFPPNSFDLVWLSARMYSSIPGRTRRIEMLKRIRNILKPGGYFILQFQWNQKKYFSKKKEFIKKETQLMNLVIYYGETGNSFTFFIQKSYWNLNSKRVIWKSNF